MYIYISWLFRELLIYIYIYSKLLVRARRALHAVCNNGSFWVCCVPVIILWQCPDVGSPWILFHMHTASVSGTHTHAGRQTDRGNFKINNRIFIYIYIINICRNIIYKYTYIYVYIQNICVIRQYVYIHTHVTPIYFLGFHLRRVQTGIHIAIN